MIVRSITFEGDGFVVMEYLDPEEDLRRGVQRQHAIAIRPDTIAAAELEELEEAAELALRRILEGFPGLPQIETEEPVESPGYDNPEDVERWGDVS